jgi:hypothetical protein
MGVFIDLSKTFDTVNHEILLRKLKHYGLRGPPSRWMNKYLTDRMQFVEYNGKFSSDSAVSCGVPQGSIFGPLLFIFYMNDLVEFEPIVTECTKTHALSFTPRSECNMAVYSVLLNNHPVEIAHSTNFLGVLFDSHLQWRLHINHVSSKVARGIGIICKLRH